MSFIESYEQYKKLERNNTISKEAYADELCQIFHQDFKRIEYEELNTKEKKKVNMAHLFINCCLIIDEIIDNIVIKNLNASLVLQRILIENIFTLKYLQDSDEYINKLYYNYNLICYNGIIREDNKKKFEKEYGIVIDKYTGYQWVKIANKHNNYKKGIGFKSIMEQVKLKNDVFRYLYESDSHFIHPSLSGIDFSINKVANEKMFKILTNFVIGVISILLEFDELFEKNKKNKLNIMKVEEKINRYRKNYQNK